MVDESVQLDAYRIGIAGAVLSAIGVLTSGPLAILVVVLVQAQPPWEGPAVFVDSFHRIQTLPYYFGFLLASGSVLMLVSIYRLAKQRAAALAGLVFMAIGAAFAFLNYLAQTTFIPAIVENYAVEFDPVIEMFSMSNPIALPWAIEMWAYGFMGLGTWLAASFFGTTRLEKVAKTLFVLNGVVSILGALVVTVDLSGVFSVAGLAGYVGWNVLFLALAVVFYRVLQERRANEYERR